MWCSNVLIENVSKMHLQNASKKVGWSPVVASPCFAFCSAFCSSESQELETRLSNMEKKQEESTKSLREDSGKRLVKTNVFYKMGWDL